MKHTKKISSCLLGILLFFPFFAQNGTCSYNIGDHSLEISPGTYLIWNITESYDFEVSNSYWIGEERISYRCNVSVNDQFRFNFIDAGLFFVNYTSLFEYSGGEACLIATLDYYNSPSKRWYKLYNGLRVFLVYNSTSNEYFTPRYSLFFEKYLLYALPPAMNLFTYVNSSMRYIYQDIYDDFDCTLNSINLTRENGDYNYADFRNDGITNRWEFKRSTSRLVASYLSQGFNGEIQDIPVGGIFLTSTGICIGLVIVVNKKRSSTKMKN